jgi:hypothetical protein
MEKTSALVQRDWVANRGAAAREERATSRQPAPSRAGGCPSKFANCNNLRGTSPFSFHLLLVVAQLRHRIGQDAAGREIALDLDQAPPDLDIERC